MDVPLIEFKDVTKRFGPRTILERVNLQIYEDQVTTLIGLSGSGKSVLLKHIVGLLKPDEGTILFRGKPLHQMKKKEIDAFLDQMSYMFQGNALFDSMTVYENVATPNSGNDELEQTGNRSQGYGQNRTGRARRSSAEISIANPGGMRKRSALARALITDPQIVLFDEPTTGLDPVRKNAILSMIAQYHKKFGFTAILVSHEISDIFFISNRILALVAAAFMVRLFILFHDCVHGSLLGGRASTHSSDSRSNNNKIISESKIRFRHALYFFKCQ